MVFSLTTLGTSAAGPTIERWPSGHFVKIHHRGLLLDCGEGIQIALQKAGIGQHSVDYVFISHLHGDHTYGLPGVLNLWALNGRNRPLTIFAPEGLEEMINTIFRINQARIPYPIHWKTTVYDDAPCVILEETSFQVTTIPLNHRIPATGFLIREKPRLRNIRPEAITRWSIPFKEIPAIKAGAGWTHPDGTFLPHETLTVAPAPPRSLAYCFDTRPHEAMLPVIQGVDVLFHEATFLHDLLDKAQHTGHSTARQAAETAQRAGVKHLILGHFSARYLHLAELLAEAQAVFPHSSLAAEGKVFEI
ncbi:MAG: ribonuclease Z [Saprospiraceae bacterium]